MKSSRKSQNRIELAITPGDRDGVGPEVTQKALLKLAPKLKSVRISIYSDPRLFLVSKLKQKLSHIEFISPPQTPKGRHRAGFESGWAIEAAARWALQDTQNRALITGPISKDRLQLGGFRYFGHTDFLKQLTVGAKGSVTMLMANSFFRVALSTDHLPLSQVSKALSSKLIQNTCQNAIRFAQTELQKKNPKIVVLGLNPHAGENGLLGKEETRVIEPAISKLKKEFPRAQIVGPVPADSFFAKEMKRTTKNRADVIVAHYHDQGLIPVKLVDFENSINVSLGLPFIRTSVDHGTAFDIAKKGLASAQSMIQAIEFGMLFLKNRRRTSS